MRRGGFIKASCFVDELTRHLGHTAAPAAADQPERRQELEKILAKLQPKKSKKK